MAKIRVFWKNTIRRFRLEFRFLTGTVVIVFLRWVFGMDSSFSAFVHGRKPNLKPQMFFCPSVRTYKVTNCQLTTSWNLADKQANMCTDVMGTHKTHMCPRVHVQRCTSNTHAHYKVPRPKQLYHSTKQNETGASPNQLTRLPWNQQRRLGLMFKNHSKFLEGCLFHRPEPRCEPLWKPKKANTNKQTNTQTNKQTNKQTNNHTNKQTNKPNQQTNPSN